MVRELVHIHSENVALEGMLDLPDDPIGVVLFAYSSGSSRLCPRNNYVVDVLRTARMGTLLMDFLTPQEEDRTARTDLHVSLLTQRLEHAHDWLRQWPTTRSLAIGILGTNTVGTNTVGTSTVGTNIIGTNAGAAAVMQLAIRRGEGAGSVFSGGARARTAVLSAPEKVWAPTLLIVGELDDEMMGIKQTDCLAIRCDQQLNIAPGAACLPEKPGALQPIARLAVVWFWQHFAANLATAPKEKREPISQQ